MFSNKHNTNGIGRVQLSIISYLYIVLKCIIVTHKKILCSSYNYNYLLYN